MSLFTPPHCLKARVPTITPEGSIDFAANRSKHEIRRFKKVPLCNILRIFIHVKVSLCRLGYIMYSPLEVM